MRAALLLVLLLAGCVSQGEPLTNGLEEGPLPAPPEPTWADPDRALIRPGTPIETANGPCPSNFVFVRPDNTSVFLGTTAHCMRGLPVGTLTTVGGPENLAVLVYSSHATMDEIGEKDPDAREYNDFAVVRIDTSARKHVNPGLPQVGGPSGAADASAMDVGQRVREWSESSWNDGIVTGRVGDWALLTHGALPVVPGKMGGAAVTPEGEAVGIVVNLGILPNPGANGVARLDALMAYADAHAKLHMLVATWEQAAT